MFVICLHLQIKYSKGVVFGCNKERMSLYFTEFATFLRTKDSLSTAVNHLNKWGCCARCILRFVGVKDIDVYRMNDVSSLRAWVTDAVDSSSVNGVDVDGDESESGFSSDVVTASHQIVVDLATKVDSETSASGVEKAVCTTCLGILQERYCCSAFTDDIARAVCQQQFEYDTFLCSISIPVCVLLREYGTLLALSHLMPSVFEDISRDSITPVKDVWKWVNGPRLASTLKCPFDQKSAFEIIISFVYGHSEKECKFLYGLQPCIFRKRKKNQKQLQSTEEFSRANVSRAINECSREAYRCAYKCPPTRPSSEVTVSPITCQHAAIYVAGRYACLCISEFMLISSSPLYMCMH